MAFPSSPRAQSENQSFYWPLVRISKHKSFSIPTDGQALPESGKLSLVLHWAELLSGKWELSFRNAKEKALRSGTFDAAQSMSRRLQWLMCLMYLLLHFVRVQQPQHKLSLSYTPEPATVISRQGEEVVQREDGSKLRRHSAHVKRFKAPSSSDEGENTASPLRQATAGKAAASLQRPTRKIMSPHHLKDYVAW